MNAERCLWCGTRFRAGTRRRRDLDTGKAYHLIRGCWKDFARATGREESRTRVEDGTET